MLMYGCTRLEIGVQSVYEDVARDTNRYNDLEKINLKAYSTSVVMIIIVIY